MERSHDAPFSIMARYQAEYQGAVEYYRFAYNLHMFSRLRWTMERSLTKTLARKLRISVPKVIERFRAMAHTDNWPCKVLQVTVEREGKAPLVAKWGGVALKRRMDLVGRQGRVAETRMGSGKVLGHEGVSGEVDV
jgi:hypothetical protein